MYVAHVLEHVTLAFTLPDRTGMGHLETGYGTPKGDLEFQPSTGMIILTGRRFSTSFKILQMDFDRGGIVTSPHRSVPPDAPFIPCKAEGRTGRGHRRIGTTGRQDFLSKRDD